MHMHTLKRLDLKTKNVKSYVNNFCTCPRCIAIIVELAIFLNLRWNIFSFFIDSMTSKCQIEIDHRPRSSGYNVKLFINSKAAEKYICTICKSVLKHAVQIPESVDPKRACQDCYQENIRYVL